MRYPIGVRMGYPITNFALSIPEEANPKHASLNRSELERGYRVIGGDRGDLHFEGYTVESGRTLLYKPVLVTMLGLEDEEAADIAQDILITSFESIGVECVEHS